jgi:hypothetical protein
MGPVPPPLWPSICKHRAHARSTGSADVMERARLRGLQRVACVESSDRRMEFRRLRGYKSHYGGKASST